MKTIDLLQQGSLPSEEAIWLNEVSKLVFKLKKAVILTGAGISCNAGIPDFRSSDGLYNMVKAKYPKALVKGQDLFDISLFRNELTLSVFCTFMEGLYLSSLAATPTDTHKFIKTLKDKNKLLRCYTQNIDSLESTINLNCGVNAENFSAKNFSKTWKDLDVVQLHGNLHKLSCTQCLKHFDWNKDYQLLLSQGQNPECENCHLKYQERLYSGKRLTGTIGLLRPDIVLYGENHPQSEILTKGLNIDLNLRSDLLIIMGTSLKVDGVKKLVKSMAKNIHDKGGKVIYVNKTPLSKQWSDMVDFEVLGDCDDFVGVLKTEVPDLFLTQEQLDSKKLKQKALHEEKQKLKQEKKLKTEKVKTEKAKQEAESVLTPPSTPRKKRPALQRKPVQVKKELLPTPLSSFNENMSVDVKQEPIDVDLLDEDRKRPLSELSLFQLNRKRTRLTSVSL